MQKMNVRDGLDHFRRASLRERGDFTKAKDLFLIVDDRKAQSIGLVEIGRNRLFVTMKRGKFLARYEYRWLSSLRC